MQKIIKSLSVLAGIVACGTSYAQPKISVDDILIHADLKKLVSTDYALNLTAQTKDAATSTNRIDDLDDFIALSTTDDGTTVMTEFDGNQTILKQATYDMPWLGVDRFGQGDIYTASVTQHVTLQVGLEKVKKCMADKDDPVSGTITNVTIYRSIYGQQLVYDYAFTSNHAPDGFCEQVLFLPFLGTCERGMIASCHFDVNQPIKKVAHPL